MPTADDFFAIDLRVGTVLEAASFPGGTQAVDPPNDRLRAGDRSQAVERSINGSLSTG